MIGLTPGNLITHLRKLEEADYLTSEKTGADRLTDLGRADPPGRSRWIATPDAPRPAQRALAEFAIAIQAD